MVGAVTDLGVGVLAQTDPLRPQPVPHQGPQVGGGQGQPGHWLAPLSLPSHLGDPLDEVLVVVGADGGYHRNITGTVSSLCQTALLYAGRGVPGEADHGPVGGVEAGAGVALSAGHGTVALGLGHAAVVVVLPAPPLGQGAPLALPAGVGVVGVALAAAAREVLVLQPWLGGGTRCYARAGGDSVVLVSAASSLAVILSSRAEEEVDPGGALRLIILLN